MTVTFSNDLDDPLPSEPLTRLVELVLEAESVPGESEVSLTLIDADRMAELNREFLEKEGPTDVLSFPIEHLAPGTPPRHDPSGPPPILGDVFICPPVVKDNAAEMGVTFEDEMALMVVHGILHILGYDHVADDEAVVMENRERELLAEVGVVRR